jgi:two-component system chemotaxis sensor kinase CheA
VEFADADLIAEFVVESQEGLAGIEQQMLTIEAGGFDVDLELINSVFRTMHSIKGTAGFLGLTTIGTLAHGLEEVLNHMRNREIVSSTELVSQVLEAADFMKGLIDAAETSNNADVAPFVDRLRRFRPAAASPAKEDEISQSTGDVSQSQPEPTPAAAPLSDAVREFLIECYENLEVMDRDLMALEQEPTAKNLLRGIFRTMHTIKGGAGFLGLSRLEQLAHAAESLLGKLRDGALPISSEVIGVLLTTVDKCRAGLKLLETQGNDVGFECEIDVKQLLAAERCESATKAYAASIDKIDPDRIAKPNSSALKSPKSVVTMASTSRIAETESKPDAVAKVTDIAEKPAISAGDSTIRVDVALLDKLMTRVGELVLARNQILQHAGRIDDAEFISTAQRLNLITTELQEGVMKTRMQPIGNVWAKFPRVVRDLASQLGKQVRIEMEGKETELDKTIVEAIKDPLTHLVRNSVDHGIESPEARRVAGKVEEGCLLLRAYHEGGQVNIEITDDGAGLNLDRIRKKAVEKGLIGAEQAARMSEREATQLILLPGFSTAEQVTSVSGRGVGMDVVKTNIEKIGGTLDVQSRAGQGTTVNIKIPLTLAIIPALIITNDGDRYAIPQASLLELVRLDENESKDGIEYIHGAPVYRLRGKLLPLVYLSERLGLSSDAYSCRQARADGDSVNIVVLRADERQFGLIVDKVNDTEEIVVKPLGKQLKGIAEYAGSTIMGDGGVALILDVKGLAVATGLNAELHRRVADVERAAVVRNLQTVLIVDVGDKRRFALPTSMIDRLERISTSIIEQAGGQEVIQYRGAVLPILRLAEVLDGDVAASASDEELQIIVYRDELFGFGLAVNRIVDIAEAELPPSKATPKDGFALGSIVVQGHVTDVLKLSEIGRFRRGPSSLNLPLQGAGR